MPFHERMKRRVLGGTGISVSEFTLGAMMFGAMGNSDHDESVRMIHTALTAGVNFIDTADVYSSGESEEIVGKALKGRRDEVVVATKFGSPFGIDEPNHRGASRRRIVAALEDSLRRLGTDHVDLYQLHRPDPDTDLDETLSALSDLVHAGKVRAIGGSTFPAEQIVEAQWAADRRGHQRFRTEQPPYSVLTRGIEVSVLPTTQKYGMGVLTYGPLNYGWLSGRADPTASARAGMVGSVFDRAVPANQTKLDIVKRLSALAAEAGMSLPHLATAFVRAHPAVTSVIIGPRTPEHLESLLDGADIELNSDVLDQIDEIVPPGTDVNPEDVWRVTPALADPRLRRR
jgi:aryl-alcohol dehydrogenase-like predicted oxidoreductase